MVLTFPAILDSTYQNLFHLSIPLRITDTKQLTLWRLLGLVENQAKLTEDLSNGLSCEKTEEELKRNLFYRLTVDELREMKMKLPQIYMSLECKQRVGEIIVATRQNPQTASYSPANSLILHLSVVCLAALLDGKTFVLPHHIEWGWGGELTRRMLKPVIATQLRLLYSKGGRRGRVVSRFDDSVENGSGERRAGVVQRVDLSEGRREPFFRFELVGFGFYGVWRGWWSFLVCVVWRCFCWLRGSDATSSFIHSFIHFFCHDLHQLIAFSFCLFVCLFDSL